MTATDSETTPENGSTQTEQPADRTAAGDPATPIRGPVLDRLSAGVAVAGLLLLATNQAPPLSDYGAISVAFACVGAGLLAGLAAYRLLGPVVLTPLWIGAATAVGLALPLLVVLYVAGFYDPWYVWGGSLGAALFGVGAATRAARATVALRE